jgi:hypothetical protein
MKITAGEWKTRDGRKAIIAAISEDPLVYPYHRCVGWVVDRGAIQTHATSWTSGGECISGDEKNLIEPWTDPVQWDWSTTPPWINWIAMDSNHRWFMYEKEPLSDATGWIGYTDASAFVSPSYAPKWSGHWSESKTMRPGFNGGAK